MPLRLDRLQKLRIQRGWSLRELARRCGFSEGQLRNYENGTSDASSAYLALIADQLGVSADYLLGRTDSYRGMAGDGELSPEEREMIATFRQAGWPGVFRLGADRVVEKLE